MGGRFHLVQEDLVWNIKKQLLARRADESALDLEIQLYTSQTIIF